MNKLSGIGPSILLVGAAGAVGLFGTQAQLFATEEAPPAQDGREASAMPVTVTRPELRSIADDYAGTGTILPIRSIDVRPLSEGRVTVVAASSGETVSEGQLLFALDDGRERASVADARATLVQTRADLRRFEELRDRNVAAEARLEEARAAFGRAEAALESAETALADRRFEAPFGGVLGIVDLDPGERVDPATIVTTLDDLTTVQSEFAVPERYFGKAEIGQKVMLRTSAYPDRTFEGAVSAIAPRIGEASRSFVVRARVPNEDADLVAGMFVEATLVFGARQSLTLPDDAVISEGTATYVYLVAEDTVRRSDVDTGVRRDGRTEIIDGLAEDDRVVATGYDPLSDGDAVNVVASVPAGDALP